MSPVAPSTAKHACAAPRAGRETARSRPVTTIPPLASGSRPPMPRLRSITVSRDAAARRDAMHAAGHDIAEQHAAVRQGRAVPRPARAHGSGPPSAARIIAPIASRRMVDAVIVGAGHNGLVAAAYLARAGLDVEVVERRDDRRRLLRDRGAVARRARVARRLHAVAAARPDHRRARPGRHGLEVHAHEPYLFAPQPDGRKVVTWSSRERTVAQLERDWSAADARRLLARGRERWEARGRPRAPADARAGRPRRAGSTPSARRSSRARSPTTSPGSRPRRSACRSRSRA